jgi:phage shock protein PspC (stress-responsive transcriptional regulator)
MPARSPSTRRTDVTDRLYRSPDDRMLSGVAGGLAEMLDIDPSIVRIVWAVLVPLTGGIALLVYIVMAIVVPERPLGAESAYVAPPPTATSGTSGT